MTGLAFEQSGPEIREGQPVSHVCDPDGQQHGGGRSHPGGQGSHPLLPQHQDHALPEPGRPVEVLTQRHPAHTVAAQRRSASPTGRSTNAVLMLGQRRRRWTNIKTALDQHLVFAGL